MKLRLILLFIAGSVLFYSGCDDLFGIKEDDITDEIFEEGRIDPLLSEDVVGYSALVPFWEGFNRPNSIAVGYDELIYVTDDDGLHVLDRAGRRFRSYEFRDAHTVVQDRNLYVYVAARDSFVVPSVDPNIKWDLSCIFKLQYANGANGNEMQIVDTLIHPFMDASRGNSALQTFRLVKGSPNSDELVEITGITVLADNSIYVSRSGPDNPRSSVQSPDNTVLEFVPRRTGDRPQEMINTRQITALNPETPSLSSAIGPSAICSFVAPPQRERMNPDRSFLLAQGGQDVNVPYRVLWISAVETTDGLFYLPNTSLLPSAEDTVNADGFLYEQFKFSNPSALAYADDGTNYIFVTDIGSDSLYIFQSNGFEGVTLPGETESNIVSFGGVGTGPRNFDDPMGVAYFRRVVFVVDRGNNRIARFKLNTDFE